MGSGKTSLVYFQPNITNKLEQSNILCPENIISYYSKENEKYFLKTYRKLVDNPKIFSSSNQEYFQVPTQKYFWFPANPIFSQVGNKDQT